MIRQLQAAVVILALFVVGCGASSRQKALKTNLNVLNSARDGFIVWDDQRQTAIGAASETYEEGIQKLDEYRKDREPLLAGFEIAYRMLAIAAYNPSFENAAKAYSQIMIVWELLKTVTGKSPDDAPPDPH